MRPKGSAAVLEARRHRAMALVDDGLSFNAVGRRLGCPASSVLRWRRAFEAEGREGLTVRPTPGRPSRLRPPQQRRLVALLVRGPLRHGYHTDLWTTARIAEVIERAFGVHYHRDHVGRLLHRLGWSSQKPERRALERDEREIARWVRTEWPRVKKTPAGWAPTSSSRTNRASSSSRASGRRGLRAGRRPSSGT